MMTEGEIAPAEEVPSAASACGDRANRRARRETCSSMGVRVRSRAIALLS